jgi:hypothetical protein
MHDINDGHHLTLQLIFNIALNMAHTWRNRQRKKIICNYAIIFSTSAKQKQKVFERDISFKAWKELMKILIITAWYLLVYLFNGFHGRKILQRKSKIQMDFPAKVKVRWKLEMFIYKPYYDLDATVLLKNIRKLKTFKSIYVISDLNDSWKGV